ncbi:MAG: TRAP transporter large permease [Deltaproteobacteria bacterium]|nr:TRAP transporter large permease [Deltaproteobacteria bacterium]
MSHAELGGIGIALMLILFLSGLELAVGMTVVGFAGFAYLRGLSPAVNLLAKDYFDTFASYSFTVIPLFILMGQAAFNSGMANDMYKMARKWMGHFPGGLALGTVVGATIFKAISGSTLATSATFSSVAIPEMDKSGYGRKLSTGVVASVGTLGLLIPPSSNLIVMGMITEQSIGKLFVAGALPGLLCALFFAVIVIAWALINPSMAPRGPVVDWKERLRGMSTVVWPLAVFCLTVGGLMAGYFTPTEAGTVGAVAVVALTMLKRDLDFKAYGQSLLQSLRMSAMVIMLLAGSAVFGHFLTVTRIPANLAEWVSTLPVHPLVVLTGIIIMYLVGGSFMDDAAFMILATPIFFPVALKLGFDPLWFCIVIGVTLMIGVIIPPVAASVFIVKGITGERLSVVYAGVTPFLIGLFVCMIALFLFPGMATWLPSILMQ